MTRNVRSPSSRLPLYVGILSTAFGVFDLLNAPRLARQVGMRDERTFRVAGIREIVTGVGAIAAPASAAPMVGRLVGDAADLAVLGTLASRKANPRRRAALMGVGIVIGVAVLDVVAKRRQMATT